MRIALVVLLLCGIARADHDAADDVRRLLSVRCPDCHTRSSAKSVAKALAVFDLDDPLAIFAARMTPAQLDKMNGRMAGVAAATPEERARVADFVRAEKVRRASAR